jgi:hypothetical protein
MAVVKLYRGPPMTLGNVAAAQVRLIVCARAAVTRSSQIPGNRRNAMGLLSRFSTGASG